jgi:predicted TIM-barrel fold metal-dependent hydrolase
MTPRADSHIHLFAGGYQDKSFVSRPGISIDEAACYDSLTRDHRVVAALVIGYGALDWCAENNTYLASQLGVYDWIRPVAYVAIDAPPAVGDLEKLQQQGFVGIGLFPVDSQGAGLAEIPADFWHWLQERNWLVSVTCKTAALNGWHEVLERFPQLRLLVSHLGLPSAAASPPSPDQAKLAMQSVSELASYPGVSVKLSGFYAITTPGHDYPHEAAWPYVEQLVRAFGCGRLLWGSDFSPCLEWVTFPQTIDLFEKMPFLKQPDVAGITGGNLLALLDEVQTAAPS